MEAESHFIKSAGEIMSSALSGRSGEGAEKGVRAADCCCASVRKKRKEPVRWDPLKLSLKLSELSENWRAVAGEPLASRSAPAACEKTPEKLVITVNVPDQMVLSSARFRKARLERAISPLFGGVPVGVDFRVGPLRRHEPAGGSAPQKIYRRVPVVNEGGEISEREKFFTESGMSQELASAMARVMLSLEKISKRAGGR